MKKILIVEDEKILRDMYAEKFSHAGFEVICAADSQEGLKKARDEKPDLILLDILLPKENGIFFLTKLRSDPQVAKSEVVAFSNYDDPRTKEEARKLGVKDYLIKTNYTPKEIVEKIKEYLK
jgi:two-component system alkaline phosphatase synthesis response regulator PhoP